MIRSRNWKGGFYGGQLNLMLRIKKNWLTGPPSKISECFMYGLKYNIRKLTMDDCGLWKRISHWLCEEPKKSNNGKSRELHCLDCSIEGCVHFAGLLIACSKHRLSLQAFRACRNWGLDFCHTKLWILSRLEVAWEVHKYLTFPWTWRLGALYKREEDYYYGGCQYLRKNIERYSSHHLRIRANMKVEREERAPAHWIPSMTYRRPHKTKEPSLD